MDNNLQHKLLSLAIALQVSNQDRPWYLPEPITVRLSEMDNDIFEIHGIQVSPSKQVFVMDGGEQWHEVSASDMRGDKMIDAIHKRVFSTFKQLQAV